MEKVIFGPKEVSKDEADVKLFHICHRSFPHISKTILRDLFLRGNVHVNSKQLIADVNSPHDIECIRLNAGDRIEIIYDKKQHVLNSPLFENLNILFVNEDITIVEKAAGIDGDEGSLFDNACRLKLWAGQFSELIVPLFRLEKAVCGLYVYCRTNEIADHYFRSLLIEHRLTLELFCVVSGKLQSENVSLSCSTLFSFIKQLHIRTHEVADCRSKGALSLVSVTMKFLSTDTDVIHIPQRLESLSKDLKNVKIELKRHGLAIVGHDDVVVSGKGLFAQWNRIALSKIVDQVCDIQGLLEVALPLPSKFRKLMEKEQRMFQLAHDKARQLLARNEQSSEEAGDGPVEYLIGKTAFCGYEFVINTSVMIPKRSTEVLVTVATQVLLEKLSRTSPLSVDDTHCRKMPSSLNVLDLGTGSGVLVLSIIQRMREILHPNNNHHYSQQQQEEPPCMVFGLGIDISADALVVARSNSQKLGLDNYCQFQEGNFGDGTTWNIPYLDDTIAGPTPQQPCGYDVIVCNPPYSANKECNRLSQSSKMFEPALALYADEKDCLKAYRTIARTLGRRANSEEGSSVFSSSCTLLLEVGQNQAKPVIDIFQSLTPSWRFQNSTKDGKGMIRCLLFQYSSSIEHELKKNF